MQGATAIVYAALAGAAHSGGASRSDVWHSWGAPVGPSAAALLWTKAATSALVAAMIACGARDMNLGACLYPFGCLKCSVALGRCWRRPHEAAALARGAFRGRGGIAGAPEAKPVHDSAEDFFVD